jgi:RNA polymerase sigma-70 factor (ECF subfamily)
MPEADLPSQAMPAGAAPERDERALLLAAAAGDRDAAGELVERSYSTVYASLFRLTGGDQELAADLTQESFRKAWAALPRFNGRSKFSTWLFRIAYNSFLNHVRRPRRLVPMEEGHLREAADPAPAGDELVASSQEAARLRRAVLELPETLRLTVAARYWGELPVREIAELEGITQPAVRKRLKKALRVLGHAMEVAS